MTKSNEEKLPEKIPTHVAIIMDGNGRWARARGLPRLAGHRAGVENLRRVIEACVEFGVQYLTIYAFSTENWDRPRAEVRGLINILEDEPAAPKGNMIARNVSYGGKWDGVYKDARQYQTIEDNLVDQDPRFVTPEPIRSGQQPRCLFVVPRSGRRYGLG